MAADPYEDILNRAKRLTVDEQQKLIGELARSADGNGDNGGKPGTITDLKGLGKEAWKGVDPDEYVAEERDSWEP